ncbi:T9SS type A sorting domain-containing protein [bacterium]|nr:T9SS type A sorting domain-containing protein [bacterium]
MKKLFITLMLPLILHAQEFTFQQEYDTIPVEIGDWSPIAPWTSGNEKSTPAFCDLEADGDFDLYIGNGGGFIWHLINNGTAQSPVYQLSTFAFENISLGTAGGVYNGSAGPEFCDLDSDGDEDLFVSTSEGLIHYWENQGTMQNPLFAFITDTLAGIDYPGVGFIDFCDIDSDDDFDLFTGATAYGFIRYYRNDGTAQEWDFNLISSQFLGISTNGYSHPEFVDIDSDNDFDLFVGEGNGRIHYYRNDGDSANFNFTQITNYYGEIDVGGYSHPEFVDIDGDGDYDLFTGCGAAMGGISPGDLYFYENIGTAELAQWLYVTGNYVTLDIGNYAKSISTDIDADQDQDIFIGNGGNYLSFYENMGNQFQASFNEITHQYQNISVNGMKPFFCDIDADQDPDLFCGSVRIPSPPPPDLYLYGNRGTPQNADFSLESSSLVQGDFFVSITPSLADVDADGDYDLFLSDGLDGDFFYYENTGTQQNFSFEYQTMNWQGINTVVPTPSCFYDIDEDNDIDLFVVPWNEWDQVWFYRNIGNQQIANMVLETQYFLNIEIPSTFSGIFITDIDSDNDGDIFLGHSGGGILFFRNTTGDTAAVEPRLSLDPLHGIQFSIGPNPANPITWISYNLPYPQKAEIVVYNLLGQKVATLASGLQMPGQKTIIWDAANYASGQYFIKLETEMGVTSDRVVVVK